MFINNQNLGRYWNIGPQETLYLPGVWLDVGLNKVAARPPGPLLSPALPAPLCFLGGLGGRERTNVPPGDRLAVSPRSSSLRRRWRNG